MGKILILAQSLYPDNTGNNTGGNNNNNTGNNNNNNNNNNNGNNVEDGQVNNPPITPNTSNHPWAYFNGVDSSAELVTPLALTQEGDYMEFDLVTCDPDLQPRISQIPESDWNAVTKKIATRAVIGQLKDPTSFMLWASDAVGQTELRLSDSYRNQVLQTPQGTNLVIPTGRFKHKLIIEGDQYVYYQDGVLKGSIARLAAQPNFYISRLGTAAYAIISDEVIFHCRMYLRNLTIKSNGIVTDFGNLLTTNKLYRTNVTSATNPVFN